MRDGDGDRPGDWQGSRRGLACPCVAGADAAARRDALLLRGAAPRGGERRAAPHGRARQPLASHAHRHPRVGRRASATYCDRGTVAAGPSIAYRQARDSFCYSSKCSETCECCCKHLLTFELEQLLKPAALASLADEQQRLLNALVKLRRPSQEVPQNDNAVRVFLAQMANT